MRLKKELNIRVGKNIRFAREKAGYTQEELSELLEITPNHLSAIERGTSGVKLETMEKICCLLHISADSLLFGRGGQQDDWQDEIAALASRVNPRFRPQVEKILTAMLEVANAQELDEDSL